MAVSVVGPEGSVIYFEKMDGTQNASFLLATAKARTSALFRRSSKVFVDQFAAGNVAFMTFPDDARPTASEGGLPIIVDGKIIGAIGVSGGTGPAERRGRNRRRQCGEIAARRCDRTLICPIRPISYWIIMYFRCRPR